MNLLDYKYDIHSCCGNDGIIEKIFDVIDIEQGSFVEFGAWDGITGCNCRQLYKKGWNGIFIEPDTAKYNDLCKNYKDDLKVVCVKSFVGYKDNLFDDIIAPYADHIDFCSIDIDGLDLAVFESINRYLPTVICMEGGQMLHPNHERIPDDLAKNNIQQSLSVINEVALSKGYRVLCSYQDTFLIKKALFDKFEVQGDVLGLYLDGVSVLARRLPWIKQTIEKVGLKNEIVDRILDSCNYGEYGWGERKRWAIQKDKAIQKEIENIRNGY